MRRRIGLLILAAMTACFISGCKGEAAESAGGAETGTMSAQKEVFDSEEKSEAGEGSVPGENASNAEQTEDTKQTEEDSSWQSLSERIAMEISGAEEREKEVDEEIEKMQEEAVTQLEMNEAAKEMYMLWDDTLNAIWGLLEENLNEGDMEALRKAEREWIAFKDAEVRAAGEENGGGSLQPLLEAMKGAELTKARVYELAEYAEGM